MFPGGCQEAKLLSQLASELSEALGFASQGFEAMAVPWVALTDPSDPFGARKLLSWAAVFYVLALLGSLYSFIGCIWMYTSRDIYIYIYSTYISTL